MMRPGSKERQITKLFLLLLLLGILVTCLWLPQYLLK